jgi:CheY-like chemotaxis protein
MHDITDKRVLIVEDNGLIGEVIAETIAEAGGWPIGPVLTEGEALDLIDYNPAAPDMAVLDVSLDGTSFNLAARLDKLGIPFIFATGNAHEIPEDFRHAPVCEKPYTTHNLLTALGTLMQAAPRPVVTP